MAIKLTERQKQFILEYLVDLNASAAAARAGYSKKNAHIKGYRLLKDPRITAEIDRARQERISRTEITADYVLSQLKEIVERCMQREAVKDRSGKETGEYRFDASGANKALELLGKHLKLFTDKTEVSGKDGEELSIRVTLSGDSES